MKGRLWLLLISINFFCIRDISSQKLAGAEIYYELLSGKTYLVTAHVYRQCDKAPLTLLNGFVIADTFKIPMSFKRISIARINDTCNNPCNIQNAQSNKGFEKHTYTDTVDFTKVKYKVIPDLQLCVVNFAIHQKLRDTTTTTHGYGNGMFYLDAQVNICLNFKKIRSPEFSFDPKFLNGCNLPFGYTPGPIDSTDFDSLAFELDVPLLDRNVPVNYIGDFTKDIPMTPYCPPNPGVINCRPTSPAGPPRGFRFDNELCHIFLTPARCDETATIKFRVSEWRRDSTGKFRLIGYVCREMRTLIRQLPDNYLSYLMGNTKYGLCNNQKLCFNSHFKDQLFQPYQKKEDTVYIRWNHGIPDANYKLMDSSAREKEGQFCWTPEPGTKTGRRIFGVQAYDKKCNSSLVSWSFYIDHKEPPKFKTSYKINSCNQVGFTITPDSAYPLSVAGAAILNSKGVQIFGSSKMKDSFTINSNGTFYIRYTVSNLANGGCQLSRYDTFLIQDAVPKGFEYTSTDTAVCKSYPATLSFSPGNIRGLQSWSWYLNGVLVNTTDSVLKSSINDVSAYSLLLTDARGCTSESKRRFVPFVNTSRLFASNTLLTCEGVPYTVVHNVSGLKAPLQYLWTGPGNDTSGASSYTLIPKKGDKVRLSIKDDNHCLVKDSALISFYTKYSFELATNKPLFCADSVVTVKVTKLSTTPKKTSWKINGVDTNLVLKYEFSRAFAADARITLGIIDENGCSIADTLDIKPLPNPVVVLDDPKPFCDGDIMLLVPTKMKPYFANRSFQWRRNGYLLPYKDSFLLFNDLHDSDEFSFRVSHAGQCHVADSTRIRVHPLPVLEIIADSLYGANSRVDLTTNKPFKAYYWWNFSTIRNVSFWAYELGPPGLYKISCKVIDDNNCSDSDTITIDTRKVGIDGPWHNPAVKVYPNPFRSELQIEVEQDGLMEIYAADGRLVAAVPVHAGLQVWNGDVLAPGIYLLKVGSDLETLLKE